VIIGFTGSRHEPTQEQRMWLLKYLLDNPPEEFHHGCCVGSDAFSHRTAKACLDLGLGQIVLHPPSDPKLEMEYTTWDYANCVWWPKKPYLTRNKDIVRECDLMIALPDGPKRPHSGTWTTIGYAEEYKRPIMICDPLGRAILR
jgi:hypothetical protein